MKSQGVQGAKNVKSQLPKNAENLKLVCKAGILDCLYHVMENYFEAEVLHNILCWKERHVLGYTCLEIIVALPEVKFWYVTLRWV